MNFVQAVQTCLKKYVDFSGRAGRAEFWWFFLAQIIVMIIASMTGSETLSLLVSLALLLPGLAVGARRMHDIGKSGWFLLLGLIPILGIFILLYFFVQPSGEANNWGSGPMAAPEAPVLPPGAA